MRGRGGRMNHTKPSGFDPLPSRFDPLLAMSYHDLTQEAHRLRRANRRLRRAIHLRSIEENACGEFALSNPAPSPKPWRGGEPENTRQTVLLAGMDCQPGQMDLFQTDGESSVILRNPLPSPSVTEDADGTDAEEDEGRGFGGRGQQDAVALPECCVVGIADDLPRIVDCMGVLDCPAGSRINQSVHVAHCSTAVEEGVGVSGAADLFPRDTHDLPTGIDAKRVTC